MVRGVGTWYVVGAVAEHMSQHTHKHTRTDTLIGPRVASRGSRNLRASTMSSSVMAPTPITPNSLHGTPQDPSHRTCTLFSFHLFVFVISSKWSHIPLCSSLFTVHCARVCTISFRGTQVASRSAHLGPSHTRSALLCTLVSRHLSHHEELAQHFHFQIPSLFRTRIPLLRSKVVWRGACTMSAQPASPELKEADIVAVRHPRVGLHTLLIAEGGHVGPHAHGSPAQG